MSMLTAELDHSCRRLTQALDGGEQAHTQTHTCEGNMQKNTHSLSLLQAPHLMVSHMVVWAQKYLLCPPISGKEVPFVSPSLPNSRLQFVEIT